MANTFDWIEIRTDDIEAAAGFYAALFGWRITDKEETDGSAMWLFDTGGEPRSHNLRRGGLWLRPRGEPLGVAVYVVVEDIEATLTKACELGGRVVAPRKPQGSAFRAYFADPFGNVFGLWEEPREDAAAG